MGSFDIYTSNGKVTGHCDWNIESQSIGDNTSTIWVGMYLSRNNAGYTTWGNGSFYVGVDDQRSYNSFDFKITQDSNTEMVTGRFTVGHNGDGTKGVTILCGGGSDVFSMDEQSVGEGLPSIPRVSNITASTHNCDLGSSFTIYTNRASQEFSHDIYITYGNSGPILIREGVADSYQWTPSMDLASQFPNSKSGNCLIELETWTNGQCIGKSQTYVNLTIPSSAGPTVAGVNVTDTTNYYKLAQSFLQNKSIPRIVTSISCKYGASMASCQVTLDGISYSGTDVTASHPFNESSVSGKYYVVISVTDSRGYSTSYSHGLTVLAYRDPEIKTFTASRYKDSQGSAADDTGGYAKVAMYGQTSPIGNLGIVYKLEYKKTTDPNWTLFKNYLDNSSHFLDTTAVFAASTEEAYDIRFSVTDGISVVNKVIQLSTAYTLMDFKMGGKGIAFGKVATQDGMDIQLDMIYKNVPINTYIRNLIYPVGSIKMTTTNINPGSYLGGTWVAWGIGRVPVGVDASQSEFAGSERIGGSKFLQEHSHVIAEEFGAQADSRYPPADRYSMLAGPNSATRSWQSFPMGKEGTGDSQNLQPYITCYMWKRTA